MFTVFVDYSREDKLASSLKTSPWAKDRTGTLQVESRSLKEGDVQVFLWNQLVFVIERKRVRDLSNSTKDGRLQNCFNLQIVAEESQVAGIFTPKIFLIIEGRFRRSRHCLPKAVLLQKVSELQRKIPRLEVLYTKDIQHTAKRILDLCHELDPSVKEQIQQLHQPLGQNTLLTWLHSDSKSPVTDAGIAGTAATEPCSKKRKLSVPAAARGERYQLYGNLMKYHQRMLQKLPGISPTIAQMLLDHRITAFDLVLGSVGREELELLRYPSKRGIPRERISSILTSTLTPKATLTMLFQQIPYVKRNPEAASTLSEILGKEPATKEWTVAGLVEHPLCATISKSILSRVVTIFTFRPHATDKSNQ
jgi:ERCC4-type nuclease